MLSPQPFAMAMSPDDQNDKEILSRLLSSQPESCSVENNLCNFEIEAQKVKKSKLLAKTKLCTIDFKPRPKVIYSTTKNIGSVDFKPIPKVKCSTTKNLGTMDFKPIPKTECTYSKSLGKLEIKAI
jgi:hypothetical protein